MIQRSSSFCLGKQSAEFYSTVFDVAKQQSQRLLVFVNHSSLRWVISHLEQLQRGACCNYITGSLEPEKQKQGKKIRDTTKCEERNEIAACEMHYFLYCFMGLLWLCG